jgi:hypothetical protein
MKKTTLFLACCIGLMFFASCKKHVAPTINVATGTQYVSQNTQVFSGDQITVGFSTTGENLTKIEMNASQNGTVIYTNAQNIDNESSYLYAHSFNIDAIGTVTITGIVTDAEGRTATASFDILCNEKPNAKFLGHYEGDILITGTADIEIVNMDPMHENLTNEPFPVVVDIEDDNSGSDKVIANITINGQTNQVNGTVTDNKVVFEAINDTFNYDYTYQGFTFRIPINMTYAINGTLNGDQLDLDGDCNGVGDINLSFFNITGTFTLVGTIGGSLNKTR